MSVEQTIFSTARGAGIPDALAALMVAQSKHETGNYTSNFFKKYNNAFGYSYYPGSKYQTSAGTVADNGQPIAAYPNVQASTLEVVDWLKRRESTGNYPALVTITTADQYANFLKSAGYYGDTISNYAAGLRRFAVDAGQFAANNSSLFMMAGAVAAFWYAKKKKIL